MGTNSLISLEMIIFFISYTDISYGFFLSISIDFIDFYDLTVSLIDSSPFSSNSKKFFESIRDDPTEEVLELKDSILNILLTFYLLKAIWAPSAFSLGK